MPHEQPDCPACNSSENVQVLKTTRNILRYIGNAMYHYCRRTTYGLPDDLFQVGYRCTRCARTFTLRDSIIMSLSCEKCGYNLRGNVSQVCPECGKPLSTRRQLALDDAQDESR